MAAISEKIELLGKGLYKDIPGVLTLSSIPTTSELSYVGGEDFDEVMLKTILPQAVEENINFEDLLEVDYEWICRCLRILNFGPYHTTNAIFCDKCGTSYGDYQVNLNTVNCVQIPEGTSRDIKISKDEFIDFDGDVMIRIPTIREMLEAYKDEGFKDSRGQFNRELARMCYIIKSVGDKKDIPPIEIRLAIEKELSPADFRILADLIKEKTDFGLRAAGICQCPKCGDKNAAFIALSDDRFFRPSLGDLRKWRDDKRERRNKDVSTDKATDL